MDVYSHTVGPRTSTKLAVGYCCCSLSFSVELREIAERRVSAVAGYRQSSSMCVPYLLEVIMSLLEYGKENIDGKMKIRDGPARIELDHGQVTMYLH